MVTIEKRQEKLGRKTIIKMPVRYAYFKPKFKMALTDEDSGEALPHPDFEELPTGRIAVLVDLKTGEEFERNDLALKTVERKRMDWIELNSETNPVSMVYSNKIRGFTSIEYISVLEYKNTKSAVFTFLQRDTWWVRSSGKVFHNNRVMYQLNIREGAKSTLTRNDVAILTNVDIGRFFEMLMKMVGRKYIAHHRGSARLNRLFTKYFFGGKLPNGFTYQTMPMSVLTEIYRVKQNPKLLDLPWDEYSLGSIYRYDISITEANGRRRAHQGERSVSNVKTSLNRYLLRGDTKQAIEACFFGYSYPKSIRKVLLKTKPLEFEYSGYKNISRLIEVYGVDTTRNFITNNDGSPNRDVLNNPLIFELLDIGFNLRQIARVDRGYSYDIMYMRDDLAREGVTVRFSPNIVEYHDRITARVREITAERNRRAREEERAHNQIQQINNVRRDLQRKAFQEALVKKEAAYRDIDTSQDTPVFESGEFIFRSPINTLELREVGRKMNICVDMDNYLESFFEGSLGIVLVTKFNKEGGEKYLVCIETRRRQIVQAKMNSNKKVYRHKVLFAAVNEWADEYGYGLACSDVGAENQYIEYNTKKLDRAEGII